MLMFLPDPRQSAAHLRHQRSMPMGFDLALLSRNIYTFACTPVVYSLMYAIACERIDPLCLPRRSPPAFVKQTLPHAAPGNTKPPVAAKQ